MTLTENLLGCRIYPNLNYLLINLFGQIYIWRKIVLVLTHLPAQNKNFKYPEQQFLTIFFTKQAIMLILLQQQTISQFVIYLNLLINFLITFTNIVFEYHLPL